MSEQTENLPSPTPAESKLEPTRKWPWWKITLAAIVGVGLVLKILNSYNPIRIEVRRTGALTAAQGNALEVLNIGSQPITITGVVFNDRDDCAAIQKPEPTTIKVGETTFVFARCFIVRATIETSVGSANYSFTSN
jgi:hypothetical protein